jgi:hypothetical protein
LATLNFLGQLDAVHPVQTGGLIGAPVPFAKDHGGKTTARANETPVAFFHTQVARPA